MPTQAQEPRETQGQGSTTKTAPEQGIAGLQGPTMLRRGFFQSIAAAAATAALAQVSQAQDPVKALSYAQALDSITSKLDTNGDMVKVASARLSNEQLDQLVTGLTTSTGAPRYIAQMPKNFTEKRLEAMDRTQHPVPYVNHEGIVNDDYSIRSERSAFNVTRAAQSKGIMVEGVTALDHQKGLYAVAVKGADGETSWMLAQVTEKFAPEPRNGLGPNPEVFRSALPRMINALPNP